MVRFIRELFIIVRPYGSRRLALIGAMVVVQALFQMLAVFSLLPFLSAASNMTTFRTSAVGARFSDLVGGGADSRILIAAGLASLAILFVGNMVTLIIEFVRVRYAASMGQMIRVDLVRQLLDRRYEFFLSTNSALLMKNIMEDVDRFVQLALLPALDIFARGLLVLLLVVSALILEPVVFGSAVAIVVLYVVLIILPIRRRASKTSDTLLRLLRVTYFEVNQLLAGYKPILASTRRDHFVDRCSAAARALAKEFPKSSLYSSIPRTGLEVLVFGGLICWVLATLIAGNDLTSVMPRVGLVAILAYRLLPALQLILSQGMGIVTSRQSMDEILRLRREWEAGSSGRRSLAAQGDAGPLSWSRGLRFEEVTFTYAGADAPAICDASFEILKGERVAFVGPTGSGKSTLIDLVLGLLEPGSGRILVDGEILPPDRLDSWRRTIGYVPQDLFLLDATIAENVAFGFTKDELSLDRVREVTELAQARHFIEHDKEGGYWAPVGERGNRLSGGQRQRLAVARALYSMPSVLILDEATSALDPQTEANVVAAIAATGQDLTLITVTHRLNTVKDYDRIYFVQHGRITACGTYEELVADNPSFKKFSR